MGKNNKTRTEMVTKNIIWAYANTFVTTILKFVCRWAFIHTIGVTFLGISGLYTNILSVLSLTELGINSAMNFNLYKPVADGNIERIKSLMKLYKNAYRIIALVISVIGLALVPFLKYLIKGADDVEHLVLYYLLYLFNTVSSYFVSYKYSLNSAEQKGYIVNNIATVSNIIMTVLQIIVLFVFKSFLAYIIIQVSCLLVQKIFAAFYLNKMYPYLNDKNVEPLDKETNRGLFVHVKSLMVHKLGQVAVNQTDNIIISAFINVTKVGLISNYTLVTSTVDTFLNIMFNNITGSLGNLCATADKERQYFVYKVYDFVDYWLYGFAAIAYASLIQAFTSLMWGAEFVLDFNVVLLIIVNTYIVGQRIPLNNMKMAGGAFVKDRYLPALQAILNLGISIALANTIGLVGVYIGTIVSGTIPTFIRPLLTYKQLFDRKATEFYLLFFKHFFEIALICGINWIITDKIMTNLNWLTFILAVIVTAILPNILLILFNFRTKEFAYMKSMVLSIFRKVKNNGI